jgi:hypothetical protein
MEFIIKIKAKVFRVLTFMKVQALTTEQYLVVQRFF